MITLQTGKPINIKLPNIYRYMDNEFIDLFFNEGIFRISSFQTYKEYPDEIRGDKGEGSGSYMNMPKEGPKSVVITIVGDDSYMLSTSLHKSKALQKDFNTNGVIEIVDPLNFAVALSNSILGNTETCIGFCNYQENKIVRKQLENIGNPIGSKNHISIGGPEMIDHTQKLIGNGIDLMFLKDLKYQTQSEFRFVWKMNTEFHPMEKFIDINCKEAIQFCKRVQL